MRQPKLADQWNLLPNRKIRAVLWRARYACERCGDDAALGLYARQAASLSDLDIRVSDVVLLDVRCARWLAENSHAAYVSGYRVPPLGNLATAPLDIVDLGPRLLTEHGRYFDPASNLVFPAGFQKRSA